MNNENQELNQNYLIPATIIVSGLIIAGAIYYKNDNPPVKDNLISDKEITDEKKVDKKDFNIRPIASDDHILGNPEAPVKLIEYSDLECPFCKSFHPTMKKVITEYGQDGRVAWVYRHFPLDAIHSQARKEAEATECANELGGNDKFWEYVDKIFEITPSNNGLDLDLLPQIAVNIGLDELNFKTCLDSGKYADHIEKDLEDSQNAGAGGTPYSVVISKNGKTSISGAQPYSKIKEVIEKALAE